MLSLSPQYPNHEPNHNNHTATSVATNHYGGLSNVIMHVSCDTCKNKHVAGNLVADKQVLWQKEIKTAKTTTKPQPSLVADKHSAEKKGNHNFVPQQTKNKATAFSLIHKQPCSAKNTATITRTTTGSTFI